MEKRGIEREETAGQNNNEKNDLDIAEFADWEVMQCSSDQSVSQDLLLVPSDSWHGQDHC